MKTKKLLTALIFVLLSHTAFSQGRPVVSDISVIPREGGINIKWTINSDTNPKFTGFVIFRDTKQFSSYDQITENNMIASLASNVREYFDETKDFKEYFYIIFAATDNGIYKMILPALNTNTTGIRAKKKSASNQTVITPDETASKQDNKFADPSEKMRSIPLPKAQLTGTQNQAGKFGEKAMNAPKDLAKDYINKKNKITKMHIFEEDLVCPEGGDEYFLFKILKSTFAKKDFKNAIVQLKDFLAVNRSPETTKRAHFYLGESYYFTKDYQNALYMFLEVQNDYNELSQKWIDSSLDLIEIK